MPKIVDKIAKKADILKAAMRVFARRGVVKAKIADIAQEAGIGKGTIYEYFRSKEDIFAEAFNSVFNNTEIMLTKALKTTDDPIKKLRILIDVSLTGFIDSNPDFAGIMVDFWAEGIRDKDTKILKTINLDKIYKEYRKLFSNILKEGIRKGIFRRFDTLSLAAILIAALDGIALQWIMDRDLFDLRDISKTLLDSFLNGISK